MFENYIKPLACLAPMDGITDTAYRQVVRKINPEVILYSEFTSINGIEHSEFVRKRLNFQTEELPYFIQLFGNEPELFGKTVKAFDGFGITGFDLNMGCPAKRIVRADCGGSLMKDKDLACRIVEACVNATSLPVTVKTRLGWNDPEHLFEFASALVDAGAQALTIHGRVTKQAYRGVADWEPIYELKNKVNRPIIGNGDLKGKDEALEKLNNLDGYMIGRAAIGNPWVFKSNAEREALTLKDKIEVMLLHFDLLLQVRPEKKALIEFRKHISGYIRGFEDAKACRSLLMACNTKEEFFKQSKNLGA